MSEGTDFLRNEVVGFQKSCEVVAKMNVKMRSAGLVLGVNAALVQLVTAHPGAPGHTHGDDWPFGFVAIAVLAAGLYGLTLKIRDSRKREPVKVRVRRD